MLLKEFACSHPNKLTKMTVYALYLLFFISSAACNKYSKEQNLSEYEKLLSLDKPFRIQKINLVWEKAIKKLSPEKLKFIYTDLKYQDKEELNWKSLKAKGLDKDGLKEGLIQRSFKAILEKYHLYDDFKDIQDTFQKPAVATISEDQYVKNVFKDKKLNKLWLKAQEQGFSEAELKTLKEEFQHHQNKIDQYYQILDQLHENNPNDDHDNNVDQVLHGEKVWKSSNPHQTLKEKHSEVKAGYDYLNQKIIPNMKNMEFEDPQVNSLWEMAKNGSFSPEELESLKKELHHFEHRITKLKILTSLESEADNSNVVDDAVKKREKKLKEYGYKVEKIHKELTSRILQRHTEL